MKLRVMPIVIGLSVVSQFLSVPVYAQDDAFTEYKSGEISAVQFIEMLTDEEKDSLSFDKDRYEAVTIKELLNEQLSPADINSIGEFVQTVNNRLENLIDIRYVAADKAIVHNVTSDTYTDVTDKYNQALSNKNQLYLISYGFENYEEISKIKMKVSVGGEEGLCANLSGYTKAVLPGALTSSDDKTHNAEVSKSWQNFDNELLPFLTNTIFHNTSEDPGYDIVDIINDKSAIADTPLTVKFDYGAFTCIFLNGSPDKYKFKFVLYYDRSINLSSSTERGRYIDGIYVPENSVLSCYTADDIANAANKLFSMLDPSSGDTSHILRLYEQGYYREALSVFRNYMIERLRCLPITDVMPNVGGYSTPDRAYQADVLVGYKSIEEFNSQTWEHKDLYGYLNEENIQTDVKMNLNWLAEEKYYTDENGNEQEYDKLCPPEYRGICGILAGRYASTKDNIYLKKFFQVLESYSTQFRKQYMQGTENMTDEELTAWAADGHEYGFVPLPARYAYANLQYVQKAADIVGGLSVILKGIPCKENETYTRLKDYNSDNAVFTKPLTEASCNLVDPVRFAEIAYHLITGERYRLSSYIVSPNHVVNQEIEGLTAYFRYSCLFKDFQPCTSNIDSVCETISQIVDDSCAQDGGILEKSFNYNEGTVNNITGITDFLLIAPEFEVYIKDNSLNVEKKWKRLIEGYKSNVGVLPNIGNIGNYGAGRIWENESLRNAIEEETENNRSLHYTSINFPYSGYVAMRDNWNTDGLYMGFYNSNYHTNGHRIAGANAIMNVTAYGRTMLISGGNPWYGKNYAAGYPAFVNNNYNEINSYMLESSTRKLSTVMVNGKSQASANYEYDALGNFKRSVADAAAVCKEPLPFKWFSGDSFDYTEGLWQGGYSRLDREKEICGLDWTVQNSAERSADHKRSVIFVKEAKLWVVLDELKNFNGVENSYSQIWNFAPENSENTLGGFPENQVVVDPENNTIKTTDPSGPNLELMFFSGANLEYQKYYGYIKHGEPAVGWSNGGNSAEYSRYMPRADVYVNWNDSGEKNSVSRVATVIAPSPNSNSAIIEKKDITGNGITGFELKTKNGYMIRFYSSDEAKSYIVGNDTFLAKSILILDDGKTQKGIVEGGCGFNNENDNTCFEFVLRSNQSHYSPIEAPSRFNWAEYNTDNGSMVYLPIYSDYWYYKYLQEESGYANITNDFEKLNRNIFAEYMNKYSDYVQYLGVNMQAFSQIKYPEYVFDKITLPVSEENFGEKVNTAVNGLFYDEAVLPDKATYKLIEDDRDEYEDITNDKDKSLYKRYIYLTANSIEKGDAVRKIQLKLSSGGAEEQFGAPVCAYSADSTPVNYDVESWNAFDSGMTRIESFKIPKGIGNVGTVAENTLGLFEKNSPLTVKLENTGYIVVSLMNDTEEKQPKFILTYDKTVEMHDNESSKAFACRIENINKTVQGTKITVSDTTVLSDRDVDKASVILSAYRNTNLVAAEKIFDGNFFKEKREIISVNKEYTADSVRIFVWENMKPIAMYAELKNVE